MITRIDEKNGEKYKSLFTKANRVLELTQDSDEYIDSLNTYFSHIQDLIRLAEEQGDKSFLIRLPLDEPLFEINANTRVITVPSALKQVGVIGDKKAEILFFRIDRYYDHRDLEQCEIWVEWECSNGEKDKSELSIYKDIQSEVDKIIFGWTIDDKLTEEAGTIKFAIHFIDTAENGDIVYRFSSLPAQISIASTLFNLDEIEKLTDNKINWRTVTNSIVDDEREDIEASIPVFIQQPDNNDNPIDLLPSAEEGMLDSYKFIIEAGPLNEPGTIDCKFWKKIENQDDDVLLVGNSEFTTDGIGAEIVPYRQYFETPSDAGWISTDEAITLMQNEQPVYRKIFYYNITEPGIYYASALNTVNGLKPKVKKSNDIIVLEPEMPLIKNPVQFIVGEKTYELARNSEGIYVKENVGSNTISLNGVDFIENRKLNGTYSFTWFKDDEINGVTGLTYDAEGVGSYKIIVNYSLNNRTKSTEKQEICNSIAMANIPEIPNDIISLLDIGDPAAIGVYPKSGIAESDGYEIEIHALTDDINDIGEIIGERIPLKSANFQISGLDSGMYYIAVYRTVNNVTNIAVNNSAWTFEIINN